MDELDELCVRMLGDRDVGAQVAQAAREAGGPDRVARLTHAVRDCRNHTQGRPEPVTPQTGEPAGGGATVVDESGGLAATVAGELARAAARLPERQREALALRELLGLSHQELGEVIGLEPVAVAPLLARSRLRLRAELRGGGMVTTECSEHERTLRICTLRHDGEPVTAEDDDWFVEHLGQCAECARAHAAMLEGSACYRGWRVPVSSPAT
jgi:hypothetical protein